MAPVSTSLIFTGLLPLSTPNLNKKVALPRPPIWVRGKPSLNAVGQELVVGIGVPEVNLVVCPVLVLKGNISLLEMSSHMEDWDGPSCVPPTPNTFFFWGIMLSLAEEGGIYYGKPGCSKDTNQKQRILGGYGESPGTLSWEP